MRGVVVMTKTGGAAPAVDAVAGGDTVAMKTDVGAAAVMKAVVGGRSHHYL